MRCPMPMASYHKPRGKFIATGMIIKMNIDLKETIQGVIPAMIACFDEEETLNEAACRNVAEYLLQYPIGGLYLTGSTGECFLMNGEERTRNVRVVVNQVKGRVPVIAHVGGIGTKLSIEYARAAYQAGADVLSSVPPFYWKFSEEDILQYYHDLTAATPLPMLLYNVPLAGSMSLSLLERLADMPSVIGMKFTGKDHDQLGYLIGRYGDKLNFYSGSDEMALSGISLGAKGVIGTFYNLMPELYVGIWEMIQRGQLQQATRLQKIATEIILECLKYDFISAIHTMMDWVGVSAGNSRKPFRKYTHEDLQPLYQKLLDIYRRWDAQEVVFLKNMANRSQG